MAGVAGGGGLLPGQQRVGVDRRSAGASSSSWTGRDLPRRRRRRRRQNIHRAIVHRPHPASVSLLRVQRDHSVRHAQLTHAPDVLSTEQFSREDRSWTHRLSYLLHVHAAHRRGRTVHVRIRTPHWLVTAKPKTACCCCCCCWASCCHLCTKTSPFFSRSY